VPGDRIRSGRAVWLVRVGVTERVPHAVDVLKEERVLPGAGSGRQKKACTSQVQQGGHTKRRRSDR
jgi:hypothetical protein